MKQKMKAGTYYIGDPCYVFKYENKVFSDAIRRMFTKEEHAISFQHKKRKCFIAKTAYGDGHYRDNLGNMYPVDAGMLGAIPVESVDMHSTLMMPVYFSEDFEIEYDNGNFKFGKDRTINTR